MTVLGEVLVSEGPVMAASDKFEINVKGKGGHGAMPNGTVDAIVEAAALVNSFQTIISRNMVRTCTSPAQNLCRLRILA